MCRVSQVEKARIDAALADAGQNVKSAWYDNDFLLRSLFGAKNWWSVDNVDHSMGFVFASRSHINNGLASIAYTLAGVPVTVDPEALQLSFYAPEPIEEPLAETDQILCHGTFCQAEMKLSVDIQPPFDPTRLTLSFLHNPDFGHILIDIDYDGHDDIQLTWGQTEYLTPRFLGKDHFNDTAE